MRQSSFLALRACDCSRTNSFTFHILIIEYRRNVGLLFMYFILALKESRLKYECYAHSTTQNPSI